MMAARYSLALLPMRNSVMSPTPQQHQYFHAAPMYHETITVAYGLLIN
jgi:hypothetical protein